MKNFLTAAILGLSAVSCAGLIKQKPLAEYADESAPRFMEAQRRKFGLDYGACPSIGYEPLEGHRGIYTTPDRIILDPQLSPPRTLFGLRLVGEDDLRRGADSTLNHELVHSYINGLCKTENLKGCTFLSDQATSDERLSIDLVGEGAATYIENAMLYRNRDCTKFWWVRPKIRDYESNKNLIYDAGYCVAREVVGKYKAAGLRHMVDNPPTEKELQHPYDYAKRMKKELRALRKG